MTFVLETVTQLARSRFDTFDSYRPKIVTRRNRHFCGGNRKTYRGARVYLGEKKYLNVTKNKLSPARRHLAIRGPVRVSRVRRGCVGWKRFFCIERVVQVRPLSVVALSSSGMRRELRGGEVPGLGDDGGRTMLLLLVVDVSAQ